MYSVRVNGDERERCVVVSVGGREGKGGLRGRMKGIDLRWCCHTSVVLLKGTKEGGEFRGWGGVDCQLSRQVR